jgi:enoyl-CoA hydratase
MEEGDPMRFADGKIVVEVDDGVGLLTFNNPAKRNAMSIEMWEGLEKALGRLEEDEAVRVVVLTGAGHEAFVSGADISQFDANRDNAGAQREYSRRTGAGRDRLLRFPKPTIARIRGFCLGGGLGIAIGADVRIAAEDSSFGIPAAKLGIAYGLDMTRELVQLVGPAHARMLLYTGMRVEGAEAARIGLVNQVVPDEDLNERVVDLARTMADNAPLSIRAAKLTVAAALAGERESEDVERAAEACFDSEDYREGRAAFKEKRAPRFQGR